MKNQRKTIFESILPQKRSTGRFLPFSSPAISQPEELPPTPSRFSEIHSPPIFDFAEYTDNFRGKRFEKHIVNAYPTELTKTGLHSQLCSGVKFKRDSWRIPYEVLLDALGPLLQERGIENYIVIESLAELHRHDKEVCSKKTQLGLLTPSERVTNPQGIKHVFGASLDDVFLYASLCLTIAETEHFLPTVVVTCVEELYRTGIYQAQLLRTIPDAYRLEDLMKVFDTKDIPPGVRITQPRPESQFLVVNPDATFGGQVSLGTEATENVAALFRVYLANLPHPIVPLPCLVDAMWHWCNMSEAMHTSPGPESSVPGPGDDGILSSGDFVRIYIAQMLLHLLPTPHFSLFVYLMSFFSQLVIVYEENGVDIKDTGTMFGQIFFGLHEKEREKKTKDEDIRGAHMLRWFLERWRPIYSGLFPDIQDRKSSIPTSKEESKTSSKDATSRSSNTRKLVPTNGVTVLSTPAISTKNTQPEASSYRKPVPPTSTTSSSSTSSKSDRRARPPPQYERLPSSSSTIDGSRNTVRHSNVPQLRKTKGKGKERAKDRTTSSSSPSSTNPLSAIPAVQDPTLRYLHEVWPHLNPDLKNKLNDHVVDVLVQPILLKENTSNSDPEKRLNPTVSKMSPTVPAVPNSNSMTPTTPSTTSRDRRTSTSDAIASSIRRVNSPSGIIDKLERKLKRLQGENDNLKETNCRINSQLKDMESELDKRSRQCKEIEESVTRKWMKRFDAVQQDRDEVRAVVGQVRNLVNGKWSVMDTASTTDSPAVLN